jgi:tetratricopeptide (TPR) repeat protein
VELSEYDKALEYFNMSNDLSKKMKWYSYSADTMIHIGRIYGEIGKKADAIEKTKEALILYEQIKNKDGMEEAKKQLTLLQTSLT